MYACMHLRFRRALLACALPVASVRMPARRASSHLPVIAGIYFMHVCMLDAMCVCVHRALLVCTYFSVARARMLVCTYFSVARARMLVRRTSSRLLVIARIYFMHVYVLDARYVRCRRVSHARAMSVRYSSSHARPPFMNARSPVAQCGCIHACTSSNACVPHDDQTYIARSRIQMCIYSRRW